MGRWDLFSRFGIDSYRKVATDSRMDTPPPANPEPNPSVPSTPVPPSSPEERQWKVILNLSALAGLVIPFGNIIAPLVIWLLKKPEMPALDEEGKKVLNFQISYAIYMVAAFLIFAVTSCIVVTIVLPMAVGIAWLVFTIIGGIKVSNGEPYVFPMTLKLL